MEKTVEGNFVDILKEALAEIPEGKIEFHGPSDAIVSITLMDGKVILVDSPWGTGQDELQRVYDWKTGTCVIRDLTAEEKKVLETKWQKPVILDALKKETKATFSLEKPVEVQSLLRDLKRSSLDLDAFLAELQEQKYSGEARSNTPQGRNRILFYQGLPLLSSGRKTPTMQEVREIMNIPDAILNFYLLGDELTHALLSVLQGEKLWEKLSVTVLHLEKMLDKLMEKNPTGHLCIHKENGDRHYCFFFQGAPVGFYDIEKHWSPVDIATMWENAQHVDYYLSGKIESYLSPAVTMRSADSFRKFIPVWNDLVKGLAKKLGKKPVEKSLQKTFGALNLYALDGIGLHLADERDQGAYDALEAFKKGIPGFLKELEVIVGSHWLNSQLQDFYEKHGDVIDRLSLTKLFSKKGG